MTRDEIRLEVEEVFGSCTCGRKYIWIEEFINWIDNELDNAYIKGCQDAEEQLNDQA